MLPNLPRQFARRDQDQRLDMMLCRFETLKHRQNKGTRFAAAGARLNHHAASRQ